ncbi:unnamed protein product [Diatraea saccharalis]|uniref:Tudor domain-containing protein n=1 Tax=Diatraea saccharalis TaxID=40085 RepID=A0A9N9WFZ6_9NEOP|nr:unnamed protein product [Diatraea saccharalis]
MDVIEELLKSISINDFNIGSAHWVDVTHINNPHSFFVRPTVYRKYLPVVQAYGDNLLPADLQLQQIVVFKSKLMKCHVRGQVLSIQDEDSETTCDLYALDNGCIEKSVKLKKVYKPFHTFNIPTLAIHCQLADCQPQNETWSQKPIESMKYFVGKERARIIIRGKTIDSLIVELHNSCPDDIATMLALCGYSTLGYGENMVSRFPSTTTEKHYFTFNELKVGEEITVRMQIGQSLTSFFVAQVSDYKRYINERDNFTYASKKQQILRLEDVKAGLPVGVLIDTYMKYERAVIKEITVPDSRVKVQLMDWGKILEVPYNSLKPISHQFITYPAMAIYCCVEENQTWDNSLYKFLYPGYEFKITVVAIGNKFDSPYIVHISPIV